jgi:hypothetical protein
MYASINAEVGARPPFRKKVFEGITFGENGFIVLSW